MATRSSNHLWYSHFQPQTLRIAVILLYLNAGLAALAALFGASPLEGLLLIVDLLAGIGLANDKRWGLVLGVGAAVVPIALIVWHPGAADVLSLIVWIALLALLAHKESRGYVRTYFR